MKVSILLTSYNLVDYIDESIQSVVNMEMPCEWELLIGDDGSTDGTVEKINAWIEKYPNNIWLYGSEQRKDKSMLGSKAAKNRARLLEYATGDYINYLDGDDRFLGTEKIKRQIEILEDPRYRRCSCCGHNSDVYHISTNIHTTLTEQNKDRIFTPHQYWPYYYVHTNCLMFRKECKELMLKPLYRDFMNDNFITFLMLQFGDMYFINEKWARYNMTGLGLWTGHSPVYNHVRNLMIYDVQKKVNPNMTRQIDMRHHPDVLFVARKYSNDFKEEITPLINHLPNDVFGATLLLTKENSELSSSERIQRKKLCNRARINHVIFRGRRAVRKIKRIFLGLFK